MPKVSFILPAYKRRFLREAIASILAQTFRDFELVVVDDCSPEDLKSVVDGFHDARLSYHRNEKNLGRGDLVASWNHAIEYAHGEWIVLASDDDVYDSRFAEKLLALAGRYPDVDVLHCRMVAINENGGWNWIGQPRAEYETPVEMLYHCGVLRLAQRMPDLMIRRKAIVENGGYVWFPKAWWTDRGSAILFSRKTGAACAREILFYWRESNENISCRTDDAEEKLRANEIYHTWVLDYIGSLNPTSESDARMLCAAKERVDDAIDDVTAFVLGRLPTKAWWKAIHSEYVSKALRKRQVRSRFRALVSPKRILRSLKEMVKG